jgi:hypothetical protein
MTNTKTRIAKHDRVTWTGQWNGLTYTGTVNEIVNWRGRDEASVDTDTDGDHKVTTHVDVDKLAAIGGRRPVSTDIALHAAATDFENNASRALGYMDHDDHGDHLHINRGALGTFVLYAIAVPDPHLAARITVTGMCPICEPSRYAAGSPNVAVRYVVEHAIDEDA